MSLSPLDAEFLRKIVFGATSDDNSFALIGFIFEEIPHGDVESGIALRDALACHRNKTAKLLMTRMKTQDITREFRYAIDAGNHEMVRWFLMSGCVNVDKTVQGDVPLAIAAKIDCVKTANALVELGANINSSCVRGNTPLHIACRSRSPNVLRLLLKLGANATAKNKKQQTPLMIAALRCEVCLEILLGTTQTTQPGKSGIDKSIVPGIDDIDIEGKSALSYSISVKNINAVRLLIDFDANLKGAGKLSKASPEIHSMIKAAKPKRSWFRI